MKQLIGFWRDECDLLQRILIAVLAGMIVVFGVLTVAFRFHQGVEFDGALLKKTATDAGTTYTGKKLTVTVRKEGEASVLEHTAGGKTDVYTVEYPLDPIRTENGLSVDGIRITKNGRLYFRGGYHPGADFPMWYTADGRWDPGVSVYATTNSGEVIGDAPEPFTRGNVMYFVKEPEVVSRGSFGLYILCVVVSFFVMLNVAAPEAVFEWQHILSVKDPEPTEFYLFMQKLGSCVAAIALLGFYIFALTLLP